MRHRSQSLQIYNQRKPITARHADSACMRFHAYFCLSVPQLFQDPNNNRIRSTLFQQQAIINYDEELPL